MNTPETTKAESSAPSKRKFSRMSTATEAQYERVDNYLAHGPMHTYQLRERGIASPAARIKEMNDVLGYFISSNPITHTDQWGFTHHRVALYELVDRPTKKEGV
jgi:hypothetical protein